MQIYDCSYSLIHCFTLFVIILGFTGEEFYGRGNVAQA